MDGEIAMALRKIDLMHKLFGEDPGMDKCEICNHLKKYQMKGRSVYKCECYGVTHSEATDWRLKYWACGLIFKEYNGAPVIKMMRKFQPKEDPQIVGQLVLDEFAGLVKKGQVME